MSYDLQTFRGDVFGGVTSAVVGLPVALAFGVASGLGALAGIYGAIAVGFFTAVFGGTRSQISGPTGPMSVAMAVIVTSHADSLAEAFTIAIMAGLIQILLGVMRIGRFVAFTPYSVISGFMSGIGIIIILVHTLPFLGAPVETGGPMEAVRAWPDVISDVNFSALAIGAVTLAVGVLWPSRLRKFLPTTLAALIAGTLLGILWLSNTPVIGDVPTGLPNVQLPDLSANVLVGAVQPALTIALLGSIDSLLTSLIADSMTRTRPQPQPGTGGPRYRQRGCRVRLGSARRRGHHGHGGEHTRRRTDTSIGSVASCDPAGVGPGPWETRRNDPPCGPCRHLDESRLGHHRLAFSHSHPPRSGGNTF